MYFLFFNFSSFSLNGAVLCCSTSPTSLLFLSAAHYFLVPSTFFSDSLELSLYCVLFFNFSSFSPMVSLPALLSSSQRLQFQSPVSSTLRSLSLLIHFLLHVVGDLVRIGIVLPEKMINQGNSSQWTSYQKYNKMQFGEFSFFFENNKQMLEMVKSIFELPTTLDNTSSRET